MASKKKQKSKYGWLPFIILSSKDIRVEFRMHTRKKALNKQEAINVIQKLGNNFKISFVPPIFRRIRIK